MPNVGPRQTHSEYNENILPSPAEVDLVFPPDNRSVDKSRVRVEGAEVRPRVFDVTNIVALILGSVICVVILAGESWRGVTGMTPYITWPSLPRRPKTAMRHLKWRVYVSLMDLRGQSRSARLSQDVCQCNVSQRVIYSRQTNLSQSMHH